MSDSISNSPFNAEQVEEQLDKHLEPVLSFRRSAAEPARQIATLDIKAQNFALHWVEVIALTNAEMSYQFAANVTDAVLKLESDLGAVEQWIIEAMQAFDERGLQLAFTVLHNTDEFAQHYFKKQHGIELDDIKKLLTAFVCGLNGRALKIAQADKAHTDTETIFLPELMGEYASREDNFLFYKLLTVYLWAQNWFGTWRYNINDVVNEYDDPVRALHIFHSLETIRLLHCIKKELPGFYRQAESFLREINKLRSEDNWQSVFIRLEQADSGIEDTIELLKENYNKITQQVFSFQGYLFPANVLRIQQQRIESEKKRFREVLGQIVEEKKQAVPPEELETSQEPVFELKIMDDPDIPDAMTFQLELDGQPIVPPDDALSLMSSIIQDLGEIPEQYLVAAGPGKYDADNKPDNKKQDPWSGIYHEEGACFYDEWDYVRQHYRKNWCVVREIKVTRQHDDFVQDTLNRYTGIVKSLRRNFEALKGEEKLLKRQVNGDDIDIDALVESYAELSMGMEMSERVFTHMQREERNIAVMFMVDMSGSTKGWINQAEREALVLLCESLELLGDRYAIYGFSGTTRKRCEIYHVKHLDEPYNDKVKARISGISAKDYTRMGFAIRHLTALLDEVEAKTKLLITLSDGKPEDYDGQYRGEYGIEDTRQSLFEARQKGIHPYCITIDKEAGDYLPHMYGAANYVLIEDVAKLPLKVSDIYRKLTT